MAEYNPDNHHDRAALAERLLSSLAGWGLAEIPSAGGERVFARELAPGLQLRVYTSVEGRAARACGADAIRVSLVYLGERARPLAKDRRVYRTGDIDGIVARTKDRIDRVSGAASELERCSSCGAPKFTAKSGKLVCAAICWERREPGPAANTPPIEPAPARSEAPAVVRESPARATATERRLLGRRSADAPAGKDW